MVGTDISEMAGGTTVEGHHAGMAAAMMHEAAIAAATTAGIAAANIRHPATATIITAVVIMIGTVIATIGMTRTETMAELVTTGRGIQPSIARKAMDMAGDAAEAAVAAIAAIIMGAGGAPWVVEEKDRPALL